ncbi:hypothetical protein [Thermosynechococcus sp. FA-CM-4201]
MPVYAALAIIAFFNLYIFSRFTVDDAFITWRYGRNLVEFGIWGYNPTSFDLTQAYTNPIYALASIIPAFLKIDFVLFFKLLSILIFISFFILFYKNVENKKLGILLILALFINPAFTIHLFSGLETFLYVALIGLLAISLEKRKFLESSIYTSIAVLTRPESWLWCILLPIFAFSEYFLAKKSEEVTVRYLWKNLIFSIFPFLILLVNLVFHKWHFGFFLPNTFYVKSQADLSIFQIIIRIIKFTFYLAPLLIPFISGRRIVPTFLLIFFIPVIFNYASSDLQMNYASRFAFHIFIPCFIYSAYVICSEKRVAFLSLSSNFQKITKIAFNFVFSVFLILLMLNYTISTTSASELNHIVNYYPRALNSHAELGKILRQINDSKNGNLVFLLGDAGMAPFHSRAINLDNIGLGSSLVAHQGVTDEILYQYNPDFIFLHANPKAEGVRLGDYAADQIMFWLKRNQLIYQCDIYWKPDYSLSFFSKTSQPKIHELCQTSFKRNSINDKDYFLSHFLLPPFYFWHE